MIRRVCRVVAVLRLGRSSVSPVEDEWWNRSVCLVKIERLVNNLMFVNRKERTLSHC